MSKNWMASAAQAWRRLTPQALTDAYLLLMAGVFPLFFTAAGYNDITRAKAMFFMLLSGVYLLLLLARLLPAGRITQLAAWLKQTCLAERAALLFALLAMLSALCSPFGGDTLLGLGRYDGLLPLLLYVAVFLAVAACGRFRPALLLAFAAAAIVCGAVALLQLAGGNPFSLYTDGYNYFDANLRYSGTFLGTIGNIDVLAAWYCLAIPLLLGGVWRCRPRNTGRWLLLAGGLLSLYLLLRTQVAGGLLGLTAGLLLALPQLLPLKTRRSRRLWLLLLLLLLPALLLLLYSGDFAGGPAYEASRMLHGDFDDSFGSARIGIWRQTLERIADRPWLGGGPGTLAARLDIVFSRVTETGVTLTTRVDNAHNIYLQLAADLGLPALAAYLLLLGALTAGWWRNRGANGATAVLGAAIVCYAAQDAFNLGSILVQPLFWLLAALLTAQIKAGKPGV